jgi:hypothetical protein
LGLFQRLFSKNKSIPDIKKRDALSIQIGDIVEYDLQDFEVVGKIIYRQGNYEWISYQLLGGEDTIWLSAEMDDELELGIYKSIQLPEASTYPKKLDYNGKTYYLDERGEARIQGEGRSRNVNGQVMKYADYCDDSEEHFLSLEDWGSEIEVSYGFEIEPFEIKIIAGSN